MESGDKISQNGEHGTGNSGAGSLGSREIRRHTFNSNFLDFFTFFVQGVHVRQYERVPPKLYREFMKKLLHEVFILH